MKKRFALNAFALAMLGHGAASADVIHICECSGAGAFTATCVNGNDSNDGSTIALARRTTSALHSAVSGATLDRRIRMCNDGAWDGVNILSEPGAGNASWYGKKDSLVLESWDFRAGVPAFAVGARWNTAQTSCLVDSNNPCGAVWWENGYSQFGGYTIDGVVIDGGSVAATSGITIRFGGQNITVRNTTVRNISTAVGCQSNATLASKGIIVQGNLVSDVTRMGVTMFGCSNLLIEGNINLRNSIDPCDVGTAEENLGCKIRDHPWYITGEEAKHGTPATFVIFRNNYTADWGTGLAGQSPSLAAKCATAALVGHAEAADWTVENNEWKINSGGADGHCWGVALSPANGDPWPEYGLRLQFRGDRYYNVPKAILTQACVKCVIENNVSVYETVASAYTFIEVTRATVGVPLAENDEVTVRNNAGYLYGASDTVQGYDMRPGAATNHTFVSNSMTFGPGGGGSKACWLVETTNRFANWNNNHCAGFSYWADTTIAHDGTRYSTRTAFGSARSSADSASCEASANLDATPSTANRGRYMPSIGSCLIDAGHSSLSSRTTISGRIRGTPPSVGPFEFGVN
jgi:hypothetical protein